MVKTSSGKEDMRSFTVVDARRIDGCPTKFALRGETGRYISRDPRGAAKKAFSRLCRVKRIRGQCAMYLSVRETTQGSSDKTFTYKLNRFRLPEPVEVKPGVVREYGTAIKAVKEMPTTCKSGKGKSSGPMSRKTSRKSVAATVAPVADKSKKAKPAAKKAAPKTKKVPAAKKGVLGALFG